MKLTMAPRETAKATPKAQRTVSKTKVKASPITTIKKTVTTRKLVEATPSKVNNATVKSRTAVLATPKSKEIKPPAPSSVTRSAKKVRKLKKAHSGVPVPAKMLQMMGKQLHAIGTQ